MAVAQKVIPANAVNNGAAVTAVDRSGNYQTVDPKINRGGDASAIDTALDSRFDDPRYYTGDTSA
jgi:hypothetical protein